MEEVIEEMVNNSQFQVEWEPEIWLKEAVKWRLPYWDWALPDAALPFIFRHDEILIRQPVGKDNTLQAPLSVPNPLSKYTFKIKGKVTAMGSDDVDKNYRILPDLGGPNSDITQWVGRAIISSILTLLTISSGLNAPQPVVTELPTMRIQILAMLESTITIGLTLL